MNSSNFIAGIFACIRTTGRKRKTSKQAASSKKAETGRRLDRRRRLPCVGRRFRSGGLFALRSRLRWRAKPHVRSSNPTFAAALSALAEREATKRPTAAIELALAALAQRQANAQPDPKAEAILRRAISTNRELRGYLRFRGRCSRTSPMTPHFPRTAGLSSQAIIPEQASCGTRPAAL